MKKILDDIINIVKSDVEMAANLDDHNYEELTKKEIVDFFNELYSGISKFIEYYDNNNFESIISSYKQYEGIISELEWCLLDFDDEFKMREISCLYYDFGKKLIEYKKGMI